MRKETIQEAATLEEATAQAAAELGVPAEELQIEVLQEPQKRTFGLFGGQPARIRAVWEQPDLTPAARANEYLAGVLEAMGAKETAITVTEREGGCTLTLEGEHLGFVIGRHGDTLDALQYLTGLAANRVNNEYYRVTVDIGNYREKREQSLAGLARKSASQAARTGRKISLEPMNPYERRIIHTSVQEIKGATSWSVGKEPNRYVVIGPSDDNPVKNRKPKNSGNRSRRSRGGSRPPRDSQPLTQDEYTRYAGTVAVERPMREFVPRKNPLPVADGATPPEKTVSEVENSDLKLYGRIDI